MFRNILKNTDFILVIVVVALFVIGVFGIYSAGYGDTDASKTEYQKQIIWFGVACGIAIFLWAIDTSMFEFLGYAIYGVSLILLIVVVVFFRRFSSFVYAFAIIDIFLRIMTFIKNNTVPELRVLIHKYLPESIGAIIGRNFSGIVYTILMWAYVIIFIIFLVYIVNYFIRKRK